jgi:hypothetical protein
MTKKDKAALLTVLKAGFSVYAKTFRMTPNKNKKWIDVLRIGSDEWIDDYPLTEEGVTEIVDTWIEPPF